jgi:Lamin Tail Domain
VFFTGTPAWNSQAQSNHEAESVEYFDLSTHLNALRPGRNILAIHGLNVSANSSDFIISAELMARQGGPPGDSTISPAATEYTEPVTLTGSVHIKSRVLDGGAWSALNEATFAVGPVAENLRITEIMYHPQETGDPSDPNEEFIELRNIGTETLNLNLVKFTNGIDFTFPDFDLAPGQYVVVVGDQQAFAARYGADINIAGQYAGRLANDGERIRLEDAIGQTILDFKYNDNWYSLTDGKGYSLTIIDEVNTDPDNWNQKDSWRASANPGGSPG